ncbi:Spx/MgsR family RNA polymerase-binding regulatory protein [Rubellicoccus peritrichatus]|uniref:Spx/MgsR family RNA polymerase-binding regulatory protein n=1 Tax=Rubellicoccus peritrichatus TaxID=3080537 RepID=A0AAQ3LEV7_9BACT|nr:Spx/MgsR family RNA polymerase-binding regulatory protein [Puniceicoccus sp. CR14]WOO42373.1 Spx/MgsR family RNA polymerase-binding regulatory protein [Puniceicoccus sp. CR14]
MLKVYIYNKCSTCRNATKWLEQHDIPFETHPIRETPPSMEELEQMLAAYDGNLKRLINTSSADYRESGLKDSLPTLSTDEVFEKLRQQGNLVKRPFAINADVKLVGFKQPEWEAALQ